MKRLPILLVLLALGAALKTGRAQEIAPPLASYTDLIGRPLFSPTRRPAVVAPAAKLASASLRLTGLVADVDGQPVALIWMDERKSDIRVRQGATVNGWQIAAIDAQGIDLVGGQQHLRVGLKQGIPVRPE